MDYKQELLYSFTFPYRPVSNNAMYRTRIVGGNKKQARYMTTACKEYKYLIAEMANLTYRGPLIKKPEFIYMEVTHNFRNKVAGDHHNYNKALIDAMQGIIYEDDRQIMPLFLNATYGIMDVDNSEVTIYRYKQL